MQTKNYVAYCNNTALLGSETAQSQTAKNMKSASCAQRMVKEQVEASQHLASLVALYNDISEVPNVIYLENLPFGKSASDSFKAYSHANLLKMRECASAAAVEVHEVYKKRPLGGNFTEPQADYYHQLSPRAGELMRSDLELFLSSA